MGFIFSSLLLILINFTIDPFQIYKKATYHKTIFMKGFYLNAGLIKNYDFDSVSIGSSMTQNFIINDLKKNLNFKYPIKLPISGGSMIEHYTALDSAIKTKKVKNVLFGIDIVSLKNSENRLPTYLYDINLLNDYKYLYSIDTLKRSITYPFLHFTLNTNHPRLDYNLMFQWQHNYKESDFSRDKVIKRFNKKITYLYNTENQDNLLNERINNFNKYILTLVEGNPNINFIFFYPPYSILFYKTMSENSLNYFLKTKKYINKVLRTKANVKLFDFQTELDVITNLNNYRDLIHYHQNINIWMTENIKNNKYLISSDDVNYSVFEKYVYDYKL